MCFIFSSSSSAGMSSPVCQPSCWSFRRGWSKRRQEWQRSWKRKETAQKPKKILLQTLHPANCR